ncbi:hypothetical protein DW272_01700 [Blautia obeum]|jgi:hypothetical protein|uniref:Bacillus phage SPbeta YonK domain-containing protein n=1 Tax=Blautia obeum TaxID=40520 RepID=A0A414SK51_9FIRM|nr:hypothetical protein [Blautia obeum]RHG19946.1 hypothetical protein DW272_01700 [Blautia obeum]
MANYLYKKNTVTTKKLAGIYDAEGGIINVDGEDKELLEELRDFEGAAIELVVKVKEETDLADA